MAPNPKVVAAYRAMRDLGIQEVKVKPVLKKLLKLYDKNWGLIEEENYRALADAIFEEEENQSLEQKKRKNVDTEEEMDDDDDAQMHDDSVRPLKRLCLRGQESQGSEPLTRCSPSSAVSPLKEPKVEDEALIESCSRQQPQNKPSSGSAGNTGTEAHLVPPRDGIVDKGKQPLSPQIAPRGKAPTPVAFKETTVQDKMPQIHVLIKPKDEPVDDLLDFPVPIKVICPEEPSSGRDSSMTNNATGKQNGHDTLALQCRVGEVNGEDFLPLPNDKEANCEAATIPEEGCSDAQIAFSLFGEEGSAQITPSLNGLNNALAIDALNFGGNGEDLDMLPCSLNESIEVQCCAALDAPLVSNNTSSLSGPNDALLGEKVRTNDFPERDSNEGLEHPVSPNQSSSMVFPQHHGLTPGDLRSPHDVDDLTKGEEQVKIPWINKTGDECPPYFHYIARNLVFHNAHVNQSLAHIQDDDCCSTCLGNCLLSSEPCVCANKDAGGFAYTSEGLVKDEFLEECIAISRHPQQHQFYCNDCPLERLKSDDCLEPCKGHLKRKFIKECWSKCGCGKHCGNRVVQRGITCNLQVFFTSEGKGWGLRTLVDLPKGTFVCEFVGEILTVEELHERNMQCTLNGQYTYPVILDSDWDSRMVEGKEALCLDSASYGNVARFINHRCLDANLIEIPVEVESPNHQYYHLAFFTSRKIAALEELTWDYGIDFDDQDHPVKPFCCKCGSKFCRRMKRPSRSIKSLSVANQ